jgi:hypothetical protein
MIPNAARLVHNLRSCYAKALTIEMQALLLNFRKVPSNRHIADFPADRPLLSTAVQISCNEAVWTG